MLKGLKYVIGEHNGNWEKIQKLAVNEIVIQGKGTSLGYFWTLFKDIIYFIAYGAFMTLIFSSSDIQGVPKLTYLVTGLLPWYFISDCLGGGSNAIRKRGGILTKIKFPISIIPTYEVLSIFYKRLASWIIIIVILGIYGMIHLVSPLLVIYYMLSMFIFMVAFTHFISGFVAISKDFSELYQSFVRIMFFFVPIIWSFDIFFDPISGELSQSLLSNIGYYTLIASPFTYIVNGFRDAFIFGDYPNFAYSIYFWVFTIVLFSIGATIQYKLRRVYADFL